MAIGMTPEEFWDGDVELAKFYREAWKIKRRMREQELWLQGAYVYDALTRLYPLFNPFVKKGAKQEPYVGEPYGIFEERSKKAGDDDGDAEMMKMKAALQAWAIENNKRFEQKGGEENGGKCGNARH